MLVSVNLEDLDGLVARASCQAPAVVVKNCIMLSWLLARDAITAEVKGHSMPGVLTIMSS